MRDAEEGEQDAFPTEHKQKQLEGATNMISDILDATAKLQRQVEKTLDLTSSDPSTSDWLQAVGAIKKAVEEYGECLGSETVRVRAAEEQRITIPADLPGKALHYKVMPFSEVCIHMEVAGFAMPFKLTNRSRSLSPPCVQLYHWLTFGDEESQELIPYSGPITTGEAGLHQNEEDETWYYYPGDVPIFPDVSLPPVMAEYLASRNVRLVEAG